MGALANIIPSGSAFELAIGLSLVSAVLHACVSVIMKRSDDKLVFRVVLSTVSALILFPLVFILPLPPRESWIYLLAGMGIHLTYQLTMVAAFDRGDLSLVYPIMRGGAPALAAVFAFLILGESLGSVQSIGLAISVGALIAFGWPTKSEAPKGENNFVTAVSFALICAVMVALYTTIDAGGLRISRDIVGMVWGYLLWLFLIDWIGITSCALFLRRGTFITAYKGQFKFGTLAALISIIGFSSALYAMTIAPVAPMIALRETSILFAAILGYFLLKEPFGYRRIILAGILVVGLVVLQFG